MPSLYDRANDFVHLVGAPGDLHIVAIGPGPAPLHVSEPLDLAAAQEKHTALFRLLALAFDDVRRDTRDEIAARAAEQSSGHGATECCRATLKALVAELHR